jgi:hypothetical protein
MFLTGVSEFSGSGLNRAAKRDPDGLKRWPQRFLFAFVSSNVFSSAERKSLWAKGIAFRTRDVIGKLDPASGAIELVARRLIFAPLIFFLFFVGRYSANFAPRACCKSFAGCWLVHGGWDETI